MNDIHQPTTSHVVAALDKARSLIQAGWCKGRAQDGDNYCVIGALAQATVIGPDSDIPGYLVWQQALAALNTQVPAPYPNAVVYNDATSQQAVLRLLDKTITYVTELEADNDDE